MIRRLFMLTAVVAALSSCSLLEDAILEAALGDDAPLGLISEALLGDDGAATGTGTLAAAPDTDPEAAQGLLGGVDEPGSTRVPLPAALPLDEALEAFIDDADRELLHGGGGRASATALAPASGSLTYGAFYAYALLEDDDVTFALRRDLLADLLLTRLVLRGDDLEGVLGATVALDLLLSPSVTLFDGAPADVADSDDAGPEIVALLAPQLASAAAAGLLVSTYELQTFVVPMVGLCSGDVCVLRANLTAADAAGIMLRVRQERLATIERIFARGGDNGALLSGRFALTAALPAGTTFSVDWSLSDLRIAER